VLNRLTDGDDECGQDNQSQRCARLACGQWRGDLAADSVRQAPRHGEPRDNQRPSDATGDEVADFVAQQTGEDVVAEFAVAVAVYDVPGDGDAAPPCGVGVEAWKPALDTAGIGIRVRTHDLRHAHASWLLAGGADLQTVKERLGHGSIITTEKYLHTLAETDDTALTALAAVRQRHRN
jgi:hypothetical protein